MVLNADKALEIRVEGVAVEDDRAADDVEKERRVPTTTSVMDVERKGMKRAHGNERG